MTPITAKKFRDLSGADAQDPKPADRSQGPSPAVKGAKTVLIAVEQGFSARYLLRTDLFRTLKQAGTRIVILSPSAEEPYFIREFADGNVFVEKYEPQRYRASFKRPWIESFFTQAKFYAYNSKRHVYMPHYRHEADKKYRVVTKWAHRAYYAVFDAFVALLRKSKLARKATIWFESKAFSPPVHQRVFDKYKPDLLITSSVGNFLNDRFIMREARRNGCRVVSAILGWDNTTTKGIAGAFTDKVIAWTPTMKSELIESHDIPEEKIYVGGVAYYDIFHGPTLYDRKWLKEKYGLSEDRKTVLLCLRSPTRFPWNVQLVKDLRDAILDPRIKAPCQLLVRPHPIYFDMRKHQRKYEAEYAELRKLAEDCPYVHFDDLNILSENLSFDMPEEEMRKLGTFLKHTDVLLCFFSSMMLEAPIFDVPVINLAVYEKDQLPMEILKCYDHVKRVLDTGGVRTAYTREDILSLINRYLEDPAADRDARRQIVANETGPNKGCAGQMIGQEILRYLDQLS